MPPTHHRDCSTTSINVRESAGGFVRRVVILLATVFCVVMFGGAAHAATYTWIGGAGASWAVSTNWSPTRTTPATSDVMQFNAGGSASATGIVTQTIGQLIISNNTAVTLTIAPGNQTLSVGAGIAGTDLDVQSGSSLTLMPSNQPMVLNYAGTNTTGSMAGTLTVVGSTWNVTTGTTPTTTITGTVVNGSTVTRSAATLTFASTGVYQHNFTTTGGTIPTATWSAGSTCEMIGYTSNTGAPGGLGQSFSNFTWNNPGQTGNISAGGAFTTVNGNLRIQTTGTASFRLAATTSPTVNIGGNLVVDAGTFIFSTGTGVPTVNVAGTVTLNGGTFQPATSTGVPMFNVAGNWPNNGGRFTPGTGRG